MKFGVISARRAGTAIVLAALLVALTLLLQFTGAYAVFTGGTVRKLPVYSVEREDKKIAITFDCAWGTEHTDAILKALEAENVRATFFMVQFWTEKYPEYVKKIDAAGHEIGTHSATHSQMSKLSESEIRKELQTSSQAIESVTGKKVELFRAPFGDYDDLLVQTVEDEGMQAVQWSVDSLDWKGLSAEEILSRVKKGVKNGSIILFHNNSDAIAEALPLVLAYLKNQGYETVGLSDLILKEDYEIDNNGIQHAEPRR